jgi:GNAT superfamily N-acetyltransferase
MAVHVSPFEWGHWLSLWELRRLQLAEEGIFISPQDLPPHPLPVSLDDSEWDYHHIAQIYLSGSGGFWLAWWENTPIGHVGGQDLGGCVELRHMYVRADYRCRGAGTRLVSALIAHCAGCAIPAIELWTAADGPGRRLYSRLGFQVIDGPGAGFRDKLALTGYKPGESEIRMRLELAGPYQEIKQPGWQAGSYSGGEGPG